MPRPCRPDYDAPEFRRLWLSDVPIRVIARRYGVTAVAIVKAADRRGLPKKYAMRTEARAA